jgi:hypothetical protein
LVLGTLTLVSPLAAAQVADASGDDSNALDYSFRVGIGTFLKDFSTRVRVGVAEIDLGTDIDLEDDLGLDTEDTDFRVGGRYRFTARSSLDFGYYRWRRSSRLELDEEIHYDGEIFQAGLEVTSYFDGDVLKLAYAYSLARGESYDLGFIAGISGFLFDTGIAAVGSISGGGGGAEGELVVSKEDIIAPVPVLGLRYEQALGTKVLLRCGVEYFSLSYDNWDADLRDFKVGLDWYPWNRVGFAVAYNWIDMEYAKESTKTVDVVYSYHGPVVYLKLKF